MADTYSTDFVMGVVEDLTVPKSALLDAFFSDIQTSDSEEIHFDKLDGAKKLAPFVSPLVQGQIVRERGHTTKTFRPAYVKPKTPLDPTRPLRRAAGEQIGGGQMSPAEREALILVDELTGHIQMIRNRKELMAAEVLRTGKVTVSGEGYQTQVVDFGRSSTHTVTLTSNDRWNVDHADSLPLDDLQVNAELISKDAGGDALDVIMESGAWNAFRKHSTVSGRIDRRHTTDTQIAVGGIKERGLVYKGEIDGFRIWTYQDWYETDDGTVTPFLPSGTVLQVAGAIEGVQAFGAIKDPKAGYQAVPYFSKVYYEEDPGANIILTQSAPLVVPLRPDASVGMSVL